MKSGMNRKKRNKVIALSSDGVDGESREREPKARLSNKGYTPANFVHYSRKDQDRCHHMVAVEVEAPRSVCFTIWNDWNRLVDFLDLIAQIGLDPSQPNVALIQCYYRWAMLPLLEIVFLTVKTNIEQDALIQFAFAEGMPGVGEVKFLDSQKPGSTCVIFKLQHQMPELLLDLKIGPASIEGNMRQILSENMAEFKRLAESIARDPSTAPSRPEGFEGEIQVGIHVDDLGEGEEEEEVDSAGEDEPSASFEADGYRGQQSPTESLDIASRDADEKTNQKYEVKEEVKPVKRTRAKSKTKEVEEEEEEVNDRPQDKELTPLVSSTKTRRSSEEGPVTKAAGRRKK